jgi:hypothetical protein
MRPVSLVLLLAGALACENDATIIPITVQWMDWPAAAIAGMPFRTRLVVSGVCAVDPAFHAGARADESAVTFAPYYRAARDPWIACIDLRSIDLLVSAVDTAGTAPGLPADLPRTYEMRAASMVYASSAAFDALPVRTFGDVTVRPPSPVADPTLRRNAAGFVNLTTDALGCVWIRPGGLFAPQAALVLENPVDTAGLSGHFVRGYIDPANPPVCGASRVFHLVSRN